MKMNKMGVWGTVVLMLLTAIPHIASAQKTLAYTDASQLTLTGKLFATAEPYHRVDLDNYPDLTEKERTLLTYPTGVAIAFRTDSPTIGVKADYRVRNIRPNGPEMSTAGFDLYIKRGGEWIFAGCNVPKDDKPAILVDGMDGTEKECLLYLPMYSEPDMIEIGVAEGAEITPMENPFRNRIVFFGSSFTHGISTARAGMSFPAQIGRSTGLGVINLGVSGNSKLQPSFAEILADSEADAFVFDAFSNPRPEEVMERFAPFVARLREAHPGKPLIFIQTIFRENGNFDLRKREYEESKRETARMVVTQAMETDPDIYFIEADDPTGTDHISSADGVHPSDLGYYRWARAIEPPIVSILSKYGIK